MKRKITSMISAAAMTAALFSPAAYSAEDTAQTYTSQNGDIILADSTTGAAASIYIDANGPEYDGLSLIAEAVADDICAITDVEPEVTTEAPTSGVTIMAGVVDEDIIKNEGLSWDIAPSGEDIKSEDWERYQIQVKTDGDLTKIIVAGADKRGTIYGLFHITQDLCGVSPWIWWADALPAHSDRIVFTEDELETVSVRPSVNYRGIFLNNEAPSLSSYVSERFGSYNYLFYANVCELMLRLKGNYLWPAMWGNAFCLEGNYMLDKAKDTSNLGKLPEEERDELANMRISEDYGLVIGFSHHEPMARSGIEWQRMQRENPVYTKPTEQGVPFNEWNYFLNGDNIYDFWNDGIVRNKAFNNNLITIGMRGEGDSALKNPDGTNFTLQQNVDLLKEVITDQKEILAEHGMADTPQVFAVYTEVQQYWYGYDASTGQHADALRNWETLKDDIIVLCDDNYGYTRFLTYPDEREDRNWGMYYHFDMNGGTHSYKWIDTVPVQRIWDSMTSSYENGIDDLWIVNVGDLKPLELPISYFIDLGYDFNKWGSEYPNSADTYTDQWVKQQLGAVLNDDEIQEVSQIVTDYVDMNGRRKPEIIYGDTFSTVNYNEAYDELAKADDLLNRADKYWNKLKDTELGDAFYQLVYYPAAGTATVNKMMIYYGLNQTFAKRGSVMANVYAGLTEQMIEQDKELLEYYGSENIAGGKWKYMMNQKDHIAYTGWEDSSGAYPEPDYVIPEENAKLLVEVPGSDSAVTDGMEVTLPDTDSTEKQMYGIVVSNGGGSSFTYSAEADKDWIKLTGTTEGEVISGSVFGISVDFDKLSSDESGTVTVTADNGQRVSIKVNARVTDTSAAADDKTYFPSCGNIVIGAENYTNTGNATSANGIEVSWDHIEDYGKWGQTMRMTPATETFVTETNNADESSEVINPANAPWLEYKLYIPENGEYSVIGCFGHANNVLPDSRLRYGVQVDGGDITVNQSITDDYGIAGISGEWANSTKFSGRLAVTDHSMTKGVHTLRIYGYEPNVQLQRIVVTKNNIVKTSSNWKGFSDSYFGPDETYYTGKEVSQQPLTVYEPEQIKSVPGTVSADTTELIIAQTSQYIITASGDIADGSAIKVMLNGEDAAILTYDSETQSFTGRTETELEAGSCTLSYEVMSGSADIDGFVFKVNEEKRKITVLDNDFEDKSQISSYESFLGNENSIDISGGRLHVKFKDNWNTKNGIKTDITNALKNASGTTVGVSADIRTTYSGTSRIFLEIVSSGGDVTDIPIASGDKYDSEPGGNISLSGETASPLTLKSSDKVYLCLTQCSGEAYFDNIKIWYYSERMDLFTHKFNTQKAAEAAMYEPYSSGNVEGGNGPTLKYDGSGGGGVKIDLTDKMGLSPDLSGAVFGVSAKIKPGQSWTEGSNAKLFFEITGSGGTEIIPVCEAVYGEWSTSDMYDSETGESLGDNWLSKPLSGETSLSFDAADTVYLCITSSNNPQWYDDISLYYMTGTASGSGGRRISVISNDFSDEAQLNGYTSYTENSGAITLSDGQLRIAGFNSYWAEDNGIRTDITDRIQGAHGSIVGASADIRTTYSGESRVFLEIIDTNGNVKTVPIAAGSEYDGDGEHGGNISLSGDTGEALTFNSGDKIYLCLTQYSNEAYFDNIELWYYSEQAELFTHKFNTNKAEESAMYEPYSSGKVEGGSGPVLKYDGFGNDGVKINLTDKLGLSSELSGAVFGASAKIKPGFSSPEGTNAQMFFEIVGKDGSVKKISLCEAYASEYGTIELTDSETGGTLGDNWLSKPLSGEAELSFSSTDTVYLCITSSNNPQWYDDISVYYMTGTADGGDTPTPPEAEEFTVSAPVLEGANAVVTVNNTTSESRNITVYAAEYDGSGALISLETANGVSDAYSGITAITVPAKKGCRIFVWDDDMKPYIQGTDL